MELPAFVKLFAPSSRDGTPDAFRLLRKRLRAILLRIDEYKLVGEAAAASKPPERYLARIHVLADPGVSFRLLDACQGLPPWQAKRLNALHRLVVETLQTLETVTADAIIQGGRPTLDVERGNLVLHLAELDSLGEASRN